MQMHSNFLAYRLPKSSAVLSLLLCGKVTAQLPFLADDPIHDFLEDQLNLHDGSTGGGIIVANTPVAINCSSRGSDFKKTLLETGAAIVQCPSGCDDADQASGQWDVFGSGPFRLDSCVCKAAFFAGIIDHGGGEATLTKAGFEPDFVSYATVKHLSFCFDGMKHCYVNHDDDNRWTRTFLSAAFSRILPLINSVLLDRRTDDGQAHTRSDARADIGAVSDPFADSLVPTQCTTVAHTIRYTHKHNAHGDQAAHHIPAHGRALGGTNPHALHPADPSAYVRAHGRAVDTWADDDGHALSDALAHALRRSHTLAVAPAHL
jgi:hypothetical protein